MKLHCLQCITENAEAQNAIGEGRMSPGAPLPVIKEAFTFAPSWVQQDLGMGQMVMMAVAVPSCLDHLQLTKKSALDVSKGIMLPGNGRG